MHKATCRGLQRFVVLFFIDLSSRPVKIAGIGAQANGLRMNQIGQNQSDPVDDLFVGKRYLIHDRDPLFTAEFLEMLADIEIQADSNGTIQRRRRLGGMPNYYHRAA